MPIGKTAAALHDPPLGPHDQLGIQIVLVPKRQVDFFLGLFPDHSKALFNFKSMPNALRDRATKPFAKQLLFVRSREIIHRRGKWLRRSLKRVSHGERG